MKQVMVDRAIWLACSIEQLRRAEQKEGSNKQHLAEELEEARERLDAERAAQRLAAERVEATTREVELLRADLAATKQNLDKAEGDKTRVRRAPSTPNAPQTCPVLRSSALSSLSSVQGSGQMCCSLETWRQQAETLNHVSMQ